MMRLAFVATLVALFASSSAQALPTGCFLTRDTGIAEIPSIWLRLTDPLGQTAYRVHAQISDDVVFIENGWCYEGTGCQRMSSSNAFDVTQIDENHLTVTAAPIANSIAPPFFMASPIGRELDFQFQRVPDRNCEGFS